MERTISVVLDIEIVACLEILGDPEHPEESAASVLAELADRARDGVTRPGSWERPWLCQAFGDEWTERLEPDPEAWWCERPKSAAQTRRIRS
jgi:hypothetical protein